MQRKYAEIVQPSETVAMNALKFIVTDNPIGLKKFSIINRKKEKCVNKNLQSRQCGQIDERVIG